MPKKLTYGEVKFRVEMRGWKLLSKKYVNSRTKVMVKCKNNHIRSISSSKIKRRGCALCCKYNSPNNLSDAIKLAKEKNGKCLSKVYTHVRAKMKWQCENNHIWLAHFDQIRTGCWCPKCSPGSSERKLKKILIKIFKGQKIAQKYTNFDWLYNKLTKGRQHIDLLIFDKNNKPFCAIEYDGEQHFGPINFGGISNKRAEANFKNQKRRDRRKNNLMHRHKNIIPNFIRISYKEKLTEENIRRLLEKKNIL